MSKITDKRLVMLTGREAHKQTDGSYKWSLGYPITAPSQMYTLVARLDQLRIKASDLTVIGRTARYNRAGTDGFVKFDQSIQLYEYTPTAVRDAITTANIPFSYADGKYTVENNTADDIEFVDDPEHTLMNTLGFSTGFTLVAGGSKTADHGPDLTGTTFFQIETDIGIQNAIAFGRSADPVLAIVPSKLDYPNYSTSYITYNAAVNSPHFFSCNKLRIDEIILKIRDDDGNAMTLNHNWYAVLCFAHEVPDEVQYPKDPHTATTYKMLVDMDGRSYKRSGRDYRQDYNIGGSM